MMEWDPEVTWPELSNVGGPRADDNRFIDEARCVAKQVKSQERPTGPPGGTRLSSRRMKQ